MKKRETLLLRPDGWLICCAVSISRLVWNIRLIEPYAPCDINGQLVKELDEKFDELDAEGDLMAIDVKPYEVFEKRKEADKIRI
jgi:hypothetical protein